MAANHNGSRRGWVAICLVAMALLIVAAFFWLELTWVGIALLVIGVACLSAIFYAWWIAQRIDRVMRTSHQSGDDDENKLS